MLTIENITLPPGEGPAALAAEAARLLGVREKELLSLTVLRRSVDAREGAHMVYTVAAAVRDETAVIIK